MSTSLQEWALNQVDELDDQLGDIVSTVVISMYDGEMDLGEKFDVGRLCITLGMDIWELIRKLDQDKADALLYVLRNSNRVLEEPGS